MADYRFVTRWHLAAPVERVYAELDAVAAWPTWWPGVRRVVVLDGGGADGLGKVTRTTWRSRLPYDLTFNARVTAHEPPRVIAVDAFGELEGQGRWELAADATGTLVTYHWQVATTKEWMNLFAFVLRPLFRWNHDVIMRWGGEALGRRLGVAFTDTSGH